MRIVLDSLFEMNQPIHTLNLQDNPITLETFQYLFDRLSNRPEMYIKELAIQHICCFVDP